VVVPATPVGDDHAEPTASARQLLMTTRSTTGHLPPLVDAPTINLDALTDRQRAGTSCAWCAGTASPRYPVGGLHACQCCAAMYGVPAKGAEQ
jgi:hypothetical protein